MLALSGTSASNTSMNGVHNTVAAGNASSLPPGEILLPDIADIPRTFRTPVPSTLMPGGVDVGPSVESYELRNTTTYKSRPDRPKPVSPPCYIIDHIPGHSLLLSIKLPGKVNTKEEFAAAPNDTSSGTNAMLPSPESLKTKLNSNIRAGVTIPSIPNPIANHTVTNSPNPTLQPVIPGGAASKSVPTPSLPIAPPVAPKEEPQWQILTFYISLQGRGVGTIQRVCEGSVSLLAGLQRGAVIFASRRAAIKMYGCK